MERPSGAAEAGWTARISRWTSLSSPQLALSGRMGRMGMMGYFQRSKVRLPLARPENLAFPSCSMCTPCSLHCRCLPWECACIPEITSDLHAEKHFPPKRQQRLWRAVLHPRPSRQRPLGGGVQCGMQALPFAPLNNALVSKVR